MILALSAVAGLLLNQPPAPRVQQLVFRAPDVGVVRYAISVPADYAPASPRPLVLALHPSGNDPYYGGAFMRRIVAPALQELGAIIVAPDCPAGSWTDPAAEHAVMLLLEKVIADYAVDRARVLVTGFSMGGRGTWHFAARHADVFTAAIPIASATGDESLDRLSNRPTYIIHSRRDEVMPFDAVQATATRLEQAGRRVRFEALDTPGHYDMAGYIEALRRGGRWVAERWQEGPRPPQ